jgi:aspartate carbamoyltransferase catalytic subunit
MPSVPAHSPNSQTRHLLSIDDLETPEIEALLLRATFFAKQFRKNDKRVPVLNGRTIINLFFEPSTRTSVSFEIAAKRLGADVVSVATGNISASKGETLSDTAIALNAMNVDAFIIRHSETDSVFTFAQNVDCPVINAGNGMGEHPSQALLDAMTMKEAKGRIQGLTVAICGDIMHSRVAHSNIKLLTRLGAKINVIAPSMLLPDNIESNQVKKFENMERGLEGADIVMALRIQRERMKQPFPLSVEEYFRDYGLDEKKLRFAKSDALVMDPGPVIRGVHISDNVVDNPRCILRQQVENGVAMRAAILELLILGKTANNKDDKYAAF